MAKLLYGRVEFFGAHVGELRQETGERTSFTYDPAYLADPVHGPLAHTLPLRAEPSSSEGGLLPFFDNLVAEGWLRNAQARALEVERERRFELLLGFGHDCAGAVSVIDPAPEGEPRADLAEPEEVAALATRASISGVQPKIPVVREGELYRPTTARETSTHIAKLPSGSYPEIVELEYLSTLATRALTPGDPVVEVELASVRDLEARCLVVRRFDRTASGKKKHFEEFAQLLGVRSADKYERPYASLAAFLRETDGCVPAEVDRLYRRLLASILIGNADTHLKNFAMFHTPEGLRLTPQYDLLATAHYPDAGDMALELGGRRSIPLRSLKAKDILRLGEEFGLRDRAVALAVEDLGRRLEAAKEAVRRAGVDEQFEAELVKIMEARWNGTFASTGKLLSGRRGGGARSKA